MYFDVRSYVDPEAVVGCEDGKVRVFDMYSRKCSQIIKYVFCFSLSYTEVAILVLLSKKMFNVRVELGVCLVYMPSLLNLNLQIYECILRIPHQNKKRIIMSWSAKGFAVL